MVENVPVQMIHGPVNILTILWIKILVHLILMLQVNALVQTKRMPSDCKTPTTEKNEWAIIMPAGDKSLDHVIANENIAGNEKKKIVNVAKSLAESLDRGSLLCVQPLGILCESAMDAPYFAISFAEFWGKKWDRPMQTILYHGAYKPCKIYCGLSNV